MAALIEAEFPDWYAVLTSRGREKAGARTSLRKRLNALYERLVDRLLGLLAFKDFKPRVTSRGQGGAAGERAGTTASDHRTAMVRASTPLLPVDLSTPHATSAVGRSFLICIFLLLTCFPRPLLTLVHLGQVSLCPRKSRVQTEVAH